MVHLPITLHAAVILAAMLVLLSLPISLRRRKVKVSLGVGDDAALQNLVRAHGNFTEYAPMGLLLLAVLELSGGSPRNLWILAGLLVVGRLVHMIGMWGMVLPLRVTGTFLTQAMLVFAAITLAITCYQQFG